MQSQSQSGVSYSDWNSLISAFPALATQIHDRQKSEGKDVRSFGFLTRSKWWSTHVKTVLAADKNTSKELGSVPDSMKADFGRILQVRVGAEAKDAERAAQHAAIALNFLRNAGIYLKVNNLIEGYKVESIVVADELKRRLNDNRIEVAFIQRDIDHLINLITFNTQEITDRIAAMNKVVNEASVSASGAKSIFNIRGGETPEIPLDARLNELKLNLHAKEVERLRIANQEAQNQVLLAFLEKAEPLKLAADALSGEPLLDELLKAEEILRADFPKEDPVPLSKLNSIHTALTGILLQMVNQLPVISQSVEKESRIMIGLLGGAFGGFMLTLVGVFVVSSYQSEAIRKLRERRV